MTHSIKSRGAALGAALLLGLASFGATRTAHASSDFPAALQKALEKHFPGQTFCVPLCTACHNTTKGGPGDPNVFGKNLETYGGLFLGNPNAETKVDNAIMKYFSTTPPAGAQVAANGKFDSDGDKVDDETELKNGDSPSLAAPRGVGEFCSDLTYGCGARVAAAPPPTDKMGLLSAGLVLMGLTVLRRRRRPASK